MLLSIVVSPAARLASRNGIDTTRARPTSTAALRFGAATPRTTGWNATRENLATTAR